MVQLLKPSETNKQDEHSCPDSNGTDKISRLHTGDFQYSLTEQPVLLSLEIYKCFFFKNNISRK